MCKDQAEARYVLMVKIVNQLLLDVSSMPSFCGQSNKVRSACQVCSSIQRTSMMQTRNRASPSHHISADAMDHKW